MTAPDWSVHTCDWRQLLDVVPRCDTIIVDAPYSDRTHGGHAAGKAMSDTGDGCMVAELDYSSWSADDVDAFVDAWSERCDGWMVSLTDHVLAPAWESAMRINGRYTFAPLPFVAPGSRCRMAGDGPSCWSCQIVVGRPRRKPYSAWGTLPGAYVLPPGFGGHMALVGGKPLWLLDRLVEDYSKPGDLVADPCCGAGTTLLAAVRQGRRAVGGDIMPAHAQIARDALSAPIQGPLFASPKRDDARTEDQLSINAI